MHYCRTSNILDLIETQVSLWQSHSQLSFSMVLLACTIFASAMLVLILPNWQTILQQTVVCFVLPKKLWGHFHLHVAERDILRNTVKIDTWQEAFGGAHARYWQYFASYLKLLVLFCTYQTYCIILFISNF